MELYAGTFEVISIDNKPFSVSKQSYNEYGTKGDIVKFYKGQEENATKMLFLFILKERSGACSFRKREKGTYEINATNITFYTRWDYDRGVYDAPKGGRITIYKVLNNGSLEKVSSKIYVEIRHKDFEEESGVKYLFKEATTKKQKAIFNEYIKEMEERYKGTFVFKEEARELMQKVSEAFEWGRKSAWGHNI